MAQEIKLIAADIDDTILNSKHELSERTEKALKAAKAQGAVIVLATGKTRASALSLLARLGIADPGIYVQGLVVYNGDGSLRYQQTIDPEIARQVITFAEDRGFTLAAYSGTRILVRSQNDFTEKITKPYHEDDAEVVGPLQNILNEVPINKIIAMGDSRKITALRWQLGMQLNGSVTLMQANLPFMLEVLPPGASKGAALKRLLKDLNIPADSVLAIGDAENDVEMIKLAGIGVAVGNATQAAKDAADHVVASADNDGAAEAIERFVLKKAEETPAVEKETSSEE